MDEGETGRKASKKVVAILWSVVITVGKGKRGQTTELLQKKINKTHHCKEHEDKRVEEVLIFMSEFSAWGIERFWYHQEKESPQ